LTRPDTRRSEGWSFLDRGPTPLPLLEFTERDFGKCQKKPLAKGQLVLMTSHDHQNSWSVAWTRPLLFMHPLGEWDGLLWPWSEIRKEILPLRRKTQPRGQCGGLRTASRAWMTPVTLASSCGSFHGWAPTFLWMSSRHSVDS